MSEISYWLWFSTFALLILTWQDYRNNMTIDDRRNYFMFGITLSIVSHIRRTIYYNVALILIIIGLHYLMHKVKPMGEADINSFTWIFYGWGLISPFLLGAYTIIFSSLTILFMMLKKYLFRYEKPVPFYGVILLSYVSLGLIYRLY